MSKRRQELIEELRPARPLALRDLENDQCRFLYDEGFCGLKVKRGKSFCEGHCQVVYLRPREKRSEAEKEFYNSDKS